VPNLPRRRARVTRGQSLVEFAIVLPFLLILVGGIIQYGAIFATKAALIQVGRDVGRWAATQNFSPCNTAATQTNPQPVTEADALALQTRILGYSAGDWNSSDFTAYPDNTALPAAPPSTEGVEVVWSYATGTCPPVNSTTTALVTVRLTHRAPVFLPGLPYLPRLGTCDASGCYLAITTTAQFRIEPAGP
jgi:Flp pilus assembly protein TadG